VTGREVLRGIPGCPSRGCPPLLHPLTTAMHRAGYDERVRLQAEGPHVQRLASLSEKHWQSAVEDLAALGGWRVHHETDSRRTAGGWPDLVLARGERLVVLELKRVGGKLSEQQRAWLHDFARCGAEVAVAGPGDLSVVSAALMRGGCYLPPYHPGPLPVLSPAEAAAVDRQRTAAGRRWVTSS